MALQNVLAGMKKATFNVPGIELLALSQAFSICYKMLEKMDEELNPKEIEDPVRKNGPKTKR